jgi:quercetin dioxygenase-like cupin family protein
MARPWIEFIFAQNIPWNGGLPGGEATDAIVSKTLSLDETNGACSLLVRYRPGAMLSPHALAAEEELYVLDGALRLNGATIKRDSYLTIPAGHRREVAAGPEGAVTLTFFDAAPKRAPITNDAALEPLDTLAMKWDDSGVPPDLQYMGIKRKVLRRNAETGQQRTFLLTTAPHNYPKNWACPTLTHPCVEEMFQIAGDMSGPHGRMTAGAYFYRPPDVAHGPFGSRDGSLSLIRFLDGRHVNIWGDHDVAFDYDVPYAPAVPPQLKRYALGPYVGPERY